MRNFVLLFLFATTLPNFAFAHQLSCQVENALKGPDGKLMGFTLSAEIASHVELVHVSVVAGNKATLLEREIVKGRVNWITYERSFALGRLSYSAQVMSVTFPSVFSQNLPQHSYSANISLSNSDGSSSSFSAVCVSR